MIKKIFLITLLIAMSILLISCNNSAEENGVSSNYLYMIVDGTIYKYNVDSGFGSPLCPDPLCKHNSDSCEFYNIGTDIFKVDNSIIYFRGSNIMKYDLSTTKCSVLKNSPGAIYYPFLCDEYLYFNSVVFDFAPNAKNAIRISLYRFNIKTGDEIKLNNEELYSMQAVEGNTGENLIWYDTDLQLMYQTDYDYKNKKNYNEEYFGIVAGNKSYRLEVSSVTPLAFNLYSNENGQKYVALSNIVSVKGYKNCLIYTCNYEGGKYIGKAKDEEGNIKEIYHYQSNKIYISNADGSESRVLCELPDYVFIDSLSPTIKSLSFGDKIGIQLREYDFDKNGFVIGYHLTKQIAIVDISNGSFMITKVK